MNLERLESQMASARAELEKRHQAREEVLRQSRALIQTSSRSIKLIHRGDLEGAAGMIEAGRALSCQMRLAASSQPEVLYAGYIQDSEKELAEAACLLAMVQGADLPGPEDLNIGLISWLNGLGEAASEGRRKLLDDMRQGRMAEALDLLAAMEAAYDELTTFDFPDALTGGLRRTCDALRAVLERTRSDLTLTGIQMELMAELKKVRPASS